MTRPNPNDDVQLRLAFHVPYTAIPQGDGSLVLRPGRPIEWLSVGEFARRVVLARNTVYDHIGTPALPESMVQYSGARRILISAAAVAHWQTYWSGIRGSGARQEGGQ